MRKSALIIVGIAVIAGGVVWKVFDQPPTSPMKSEASLESPSGTTPRASLDGQLGSGNAEESPAVPQPTQLGANADAVESVSLIPTPPEFDHIPAEEKYWHHEKWRELHQRLEREPIDVEWSRTAEATIASAIGAQQEIGRHGAPVINCRSKTCEVQMRAFGAPDIDEHEWSKRFGAVYSALRPEFKLEDFSVASAPGETAMILHISKLELK
jgi:hypothetical protein